ncbi:MAG: hypothetical protein WCI59_20570 [Betaproteobacteria bacterium]
MSLQQIVNVRRWHLLHRERHPLEFHLWDLMLTLWVMGWMAVPINVVLGFPAMAALALLGTGAPGLYVVLRRHLHQRSRLRCDWLCACRRTDTR